MSDVKEVVRSRYAGVAKQLADLQILQPSSDGGCCQADGPDCGCSGSYSAAELSEVGLTESVEMSAAIRACDLNARAAGLTRCGTGSA